jgi:cytosine/adenosine deaminase-related metal-dependent hydrolase
MSVQAALTKFQQYHQSCNDRLHVWMAAETPRGVDESIYAEVGEACQKHNIRLTVHVAEAARDRELIKECYHATPVQFCRNNKITSDRTVLAHMCHLDLDVDLDILKSTGTSVVHNPTSNCKLADGIAAIPQMLAKGINVALGSDGAPCSNTYDLFRDMHLAGIIHKGVAENGSLLPSEQVLEMATINGAKALGLEKEIGSLEVGKKADFAVIDTSALYAAPFEVPQLGKGGMHAATVVVHSCTGNDVDMVVVDGIVVVENGKLISVNEEEVKQKAREATIKIRQRSGVDAQPSKMGWTYV